LIAPTKNDTHSLTRRFAQKPGTDKAFAYDAHRREPISLSLRGLTNDVPRAAIARGFPGTCVDAYRGLTNR